MARKKRDEETDEAREEGREKGRAREARAELDEARDRRELEETWKSPPGVMKWLAETNHKVVAMRYIVTAFVFFLLAGLEAAAMRLQLSRPENRFLTPDLYNQIFTMHGTTMMFLFAVPVMEAMGLYFVPMMIGTRNVAFPRMNAFGYYCYLLGGILVYAFFILNIGPDTGWFSYVPLAGPQYSPGKRVDVWAQMISLTEIAALVGAVEIVVTVFKQRAPGMSLNRLPLFVWSQLVTSFMIIFAMPAVMLASSMLAMDRLIDTHFFNPAEGGDSLLYQHMFWFFGHPEVYIIFIPALGFVSSIVVTFSRRKIFGYVPMVLALIATGFIGFGLWVHHMFATPLPQLGQSFFTGASMMIAIPSGVQIFCWIATLWGGRLDLKTPLWFVIGFVAIFVLGGLSGIVLASVPLDLQVHDTYFVVAHFHYVLIGGAVFPLFGAVYYWFPKWTGRMLSERLGKINFWLMFVGFNLIFFPMHRLGLMGMPRRVYTYLPETGWGDMNLLASLGAVVMTLGVVAFLANVWVSRREGALAGADPWGADTLEWATPSPAPNYNFVYLPVVEGRYALWEQSADPPVVVGTETECREVLCTKIMDAEPDHRYELPGPSVFPVLLALTVFIAFSAGIFTPWAFPVSAALTAAVLYGWFWSERYSKNEPVKEGRWEFGRRARRRAREARRLAAEEGA